MTLDVTTSLLPYPLSSSLYLSIPVCHHCLCLFLSACTYNGGQRSVLGVFHQSFTWILKQPLTVPGFAGIIITRTPPLFISSALGLWVCTRDPNSDPYVICQVLY